MINKELFQEAWKGFLNKDENMPKEKSGDDYSMAKFDSTAVENAKTAMKLNKIEELWSLFGLRRLETFSDRNVGWATAAVFDKILPLKRHKIIKILGKGSKGMVYELDNGTVLKLFSGGYMRDRTGNEEMKFYKTSKDKLFSKTASLHTLPVYDSGVVKNIYKFIASNIINSPRFKRKVQNWPPDAWMTSIYWAEMAKIRPLDEYINESGRDPGDWYGVLPAIEDLVLSKMKELPEERIAVKRANTLRLAERAEMSTNEFIGLMKMILYVIKNYGPRYLMDMHSGNIGVLENSIPRHGAEHDNMRLTDTSAKPVFILFDP